MTQEVEKKFEARKKLFIKKIAELLSFYEWNHQLIRQAEEECDLEKGYHLILFPEGVNQILEIFERNEDQKMVDFLKYEVLAAKVREKIALALKIRIKNCSSKEIIKKNYNYFVKSPDLVLLTKITWQTCDEIWRYAGDKSIDFNHYSKRLLLSSVYLSSMVFYINDNSEDHKKTDNFIDESLTKIINIASFKNFCKLPKLEDIPILRLFS